MTRTISMIALLGAAALLAGTAPLIAGQTAPPPTLDMREADQSWVDDPHVHDFYRLTVAAFAHGPQRIDRAGYEKSSRAIFRALAQARHMSPDAFETHVAAIPGQMIDIVTRDPQTLASYAAFATALFGPQAGSPDK